MEKKKIIIIGAGISGLTAGIYALENGYDVEIYEKHSIVGGQCTGWKRKNVLIDGCAHWIVGTNYNSDLNPLWQHVGAMDTSTKIYETEYFGKYDIDGDIITFYADLKLLEAELLRVSKEDKKQIRNFIKGIKSYQYVRIPVKKPLDHMNLFELMSIGIKMLPMAIKYIFYKTISVGDYASKFKSEKLRKLFSKVLTENYTIHSMFYIMQALSKKDAGVPEGGSVKFVENIKEKYLSKGGKIFINQEIKNVIIENDTAKGICLQNNDKIYADYIISSVDAHHTVYDLLEAKYHDEYFETRFSNNIDNPLILGILPSYKVNVDVNHLPKMMDFDIEPININGFMIKDINVRNYSFDKTLNKNCTTFSVLIHSNEQVYDYLASLDKESYLSLKNNLGEKVRKEICKYYNLKDEDIELLDVATPLTHHRYTNAYKGSYMSFLTTKNSKGLMRKGLIKGLNNFVMTGQWLMPPGGLPIALFTGKHAICRICKMDKKKFVDNDYLYKVNNKVKTLKKTTC